MDKPRYIVWLKDSFQPNLFTLSALENHFGFVFHNEYYFESKTERSFVRSQMTHPHKPEDREIGQQFEREIRGQKTAPSSVRWINEEMGYGLVTEEAIEKEAFVGRYTGKIRQNNQHFEFNQYLYKYPAKDDIGRNYVIDAHSGNLTRFINHSFSPNLKSIYAYCGGMYHLIFVAAHFIPKDKQLSFNYGNSYWKLRAHPQRIT